MSAHTTGAPRGRPGHGRPDNLLFAGHPVRTRQAVAETQHLHDVAAVMRSHRDAAPNRLKDTITEHVRSERLTSLRK